MEGLRRLPCYHKQLVSSQAGGCPPRERLQLREGNIENCLVYYERENRAGPKQSDVSLFPVVPDSALKDILSQSLGVLVVVEKQREIYFIDNLKFHIDVVENLGSFVEIEAIDADGSLGIA